VTRFSGEKRGKKQEPRLISTVKRGSKVPAKHRENPDFRLAKKRFRGRFVIASTPLVGAAGFVDNRQERFLAHFKPAKAIIGQVPKNVRCPSFCLLAIRPCCGSACSMTGRWFGLSALAEKGRTMKTRVIGALAAILLGAVPGPVVAGGPSFQGLGDLPGGGFSSLAYDVSADGSTVVGNGESASGTEAFRWRLDTGMQGLGDLPGGDFFSHAQDVSADGSVIVG
jgi:hypothetical protein